MKKCMCGSRPIRGWFLVFLVLAVFAVPLFAADRSAGFSYVRDMGRGINLGNTLEAGAWGQWNAEVHEYFFDDYVAAGFTSVRIPVFWGGKAQDLAPYTIDAAWMDKVEQTVDLALSKGLYVMLNAHHEHWVKLEPTEENFQRFEGIWNQIAERFKNKSERLSFEIINEPYHGGSSHSVITDAQLRDLQQRVLKVIRGTHTTPAQLRNQTRYVLFNGNSFDISNCVYSMGVLPEDDYLLATIHTYAPYDFGLTGSTSWGSQADYDAMDNELAAVYNWSIANGTALQMGEFGAVTCWSTDGYSCAGPHPYPEDRPLWYRNMVEKMVGYGISFTVWDVIGTFQHYNRSVAEPKWEQPAIVDILINAGSWPSNLPAQVSSPLPIDGSTNQYINADLMWDAAMHATGYDVYFGTSANLTTSDFKGSQAGRIYDLGTLDSNTTYYWTIDSVNYNGTTAGDVWSFTTGILPSSDHVVTDASDSYVITDQQISTASATATQKNTAYNAPASNALDGDTGNYTHTDTSTPDNWWKVELPADQNISWIKIYNRNGNGTRLNNCEIKVLNASGTAVWTSNYKLENGFDGSVHNVPVNSGNGVTGRGVWIGLTNSEKNGENNYVVSLAEVKLYEATSTPPAQAVNVAPSDSAVDVSINPTLSWSNGGGATLYDVYLDGSRISQGQTGTSYTLSSLHHSTAYTWRVDAISAGGTTQGTDWHFTTEAAPSGSGPSNTPGCVLWLDGADLDGDGVSEGASEAGLSGNSVTTWADKSGSGNAATQLNAAKQAQLAVDQVNGNDLVRFDGSDDTFSFPEISDIRTVFWVVKEESDATATRFLLGHASSYEFHRDEAALWHSNYSHEHIKNGTTRLNGEVVNGTTTALPKGSLNIVELSTAGNVKANQLTQDRGKPERSWDGDIAEIVIYNQVLSDSDRQAVEDYLTEKWVTTTQDTTPPAAPTGLTAQSEVGQISLDWDDNSESDLASYTVYRSLTQSGGYSVITSGLATSEYIDATAPVGTNFFFKVVAVDTSNNYSTRSSAASGAASNPPPAQAENVSPLDTAVDVGINPTLSWSNGGGATSYDVYLDGSRVSQGQTGTTYSPSTLAYGTAYTWRVDAINAAGITQGEDWNFTTAVAQGGSGPSNTTGCVLWLDGADLDGDGVSEGTSEAGLSGNSVTTWADKSGSGNAATQLNAAKQAELAVDQVNGNDLVRFDGSDDTFSFPEISDIRTVFWVIKEESDATATRFLLGHESSYEFHRDEAAAGTIWHSNYSHEHIKNGTTRLNGEVVNGTTTALPKGSLNTVVLSTTGNVKANQLTQDRGLQDRSWDGDIAEIVIYNQVLSDSDRQAVEDYLTEKWVTTTQDTTPPAAPTGLTAQSEVGQISLDWDDNSESDLASYTVYRSLTQSGGYSVITSGLTTSEYIDATAPVSTNFFFKVVAVDTSNNYSTRSSAASGEAQEQSPQIDPRSIAGCVFWLDGNDLDGDGESEGASENGVDGSGFVSTWADKSGNANDASQATSAEQAVLTVNGMNGKSVVRFDGVDDYLSFHSITNIRTVFWVVKEDSGATDGRNLLGHSDSNSFEFSRGLEASPSTIWHGDFASGNIKAGTTRLNGSVVDGTTTALPAGAVSLISVVTAGDVPANQLSKDRWFADRSWDGDIAEVIIYTTELSSADVAAVEAYLTDKWIASEPPTGSDGYAGWIASHELAGEHAETDADPDGDGLSNLYEYALGGKPNDDTDQGVEPTFTILSQGGSNVVEYVHVQRVDANNGLTYTLEWKNALEDETWLSTGFTITSGSMNAALDTVTNIIPADVTAKFIKLRITN